MQKKVFLETFGCQMNILDSELVQSKLSQEGYQFVEKQEDANVVLFNTCSVRDLSEQKVLSRLGIVKQRKEEGENVVVGVLGCMAERAGTDLLGKNKQIDLLVGPSKLDQVPELLGRLTSTLTLPSPDQREREKLVALSNFRERKGKSSDATMMDDDLESLDQSRLAHLALSKGQAYVRITRGCNKFCSFCVVPRTRGPEAHRPADSIVEEVKKLSDSGVLEVTLLGQTINHYPDFAGLLRRIHDEAPALPRLRFMTSYPRDFTDEALDVMASSERICKYLHIPAQSGSDRVLLRMNRGYDRRTYVSLIERARARMPDISIVGDMIVGFPGETEEDFEESLSLLREVRYKNLFIFKYSPRPGTVANKRDLDDIPMAVKNDRNQRMLALQREISLEHHQQMVGKEYRVIVEGPAKIGSDRLTSRTEGDHIVSFDGPKSLIGQIVTIKITAATALSLSGNLVHDRAAAHLS